MIVFLLSVSLQHFIIGVSLKLLLYDNPLQSRALVQAREEVEDGAVVDVLEVTVVDVGSDVGVVDVTAWTTHLRVVDIGNQTDSFITEVITARLKKNIRFQQHSYFDKTCSVFVVVMVVGSTVILNKIRAPDFDMSSSCYSTAFLI